MKNLRIKIQRLLRRLFVGRRVEKIYPSPRPGARNHGEIFDDNVADDVPGFSGMELLLEPNPEKEFTYEDLQLLTNNFSRENFFGHTLFGKLYLGRIPDGWKGMEAQYVTVKTWNQNTGFRGVNWETLVRQARPNDALNRMASEINFLCQPEMESHPNLATVKGYCFEQNKMGAVYSIDARGTIRRLAKHGPFTWACRIKVALGLSRLLEFLHGQPQFLVRNLAAAHIMLDKDWNPVLVDCSMLVGGGFGDTRKAGFGVPWGTRGYIDRMNISDVWTEKNDVFAFGVILLELISKSRFDGKKYEGYTLDNLGPVIYHLFAAENGEENTSFANGINFGNDPTFVNCDGYEDGATISKLAIRCLEKNQGPRPTMTEIIEELEKLLVCKEWEMVKTDDGRLQNAAIQPHG